MRQDINKYYVIFRRYRSTFVMIIFILIGLSVFSINASRDSVTSISGRFFLEILGPAQYIANTMGCLVGTFWGRYFALTNAARQVEELKRQVAIYRQQLSDVEELKIANQRLRDLLKLREFTNFPQIAAHVVGFDPTDYFRIVIIDKGSRDKVMTQMPVINLQGIIGRVIWTSSNYAKVLLLVDPNAAIDVLVQRTRARGIVTGINRDTLRLKYIQHSEEVAPGDRLIASGSDGVFPKGILVGFVRAVKQECNGIFQYIEVEPAVNFESLEEVNIILHRRSFDG